MLRNVRQNLGALGNFLRHVYRRVGWKRGLIALACIFVLIIAGRAFLGGPAEVTAQQNVRAVEVRSVADLSSGATPLSIVGEVTSRSEASVRAESSGEVTSVSHELGDYVGAGGVVAELENASQRAAVLQAQGSVEAAQAALDKLQKGTRSEQLSILQSADEAAKSGAVNSLLSAYAAIDNAIRGTTDTFFTNPQGAVPRFNVSTSNSDLKNSAENMRVALSKVLDREKERAVTLTTSSDLKVELSVTEDELRSVRSFLDTVIAALNAGIATPDYPQATISTYIANATAARTSIQSALASITSAKQALETAQKNLEQGVTGAVPEDLAASQAALKQAQGALAAARANLEKTIIRSPISGTINSFSLKRGDFVSQSQEVLTVANNGTLEIVAYITENDAREISVGQKVTTDAGVGGVVTKIAPALDPLTKKIEVRIALESTHNITNGQSVLVSIARSLRSSTPSKPGSRITIPISAIKVEADTVSVFTVSSSSALVAHPVELGALLGDRVEILSGTSPDMEIVTDARGLREGQNVLIAQ